MYNMAGPLDNNVYSLPKEAAIADNANDYNDNLISPTHPISDICIGNVMMNKGSQDEIVVSFPNNNSAPGAEALAVGDSAIIDFIVNEGIKWKFPPEWDVSHIVDFKELELGWQIEIALYARLNLEQLGDFVAQREGVQA